MGLNTNFRSRFTGTDIKGKPQIRTSYTTLINSILPNTRGANRPCTPRRPHTVFQWYPNPTKPNSQTHEEDPVSSLAPPSFSVFPFCPVRIGGLPFGRRQCFAGGWHHRRGSRLLYFGPDQ